METLKHIWEQFVGFIKEYDARRIAEAIREVDWLEMLSSPLAWLAILVFLGYVLWKKQLRMLVLVVSVGLFFYLLQITLPAAGEDISLADLLKFIGGSMAILAVDVYFLLMRD